METPPKKEIPKRSCMITLMFGIDNDAQALAVKKVIDDAVKNIEEKRYTFQLNEN
ncbi:unnamed protein product [marine sediment metagenome]|uniref:Uncharacterized protein n=1 Tax=marine sediment metagenome TaxID=412755 RepID=X1UGU2_9ZZZZ